VSRRVDEHERRARLAHRHRLIAARRTDDVAAITESLVGLHSSDPTSVYLSAMARMHRPSVDAVAAALFVDHIVMRHHAMRRTLWVFTPDTARVAHAAATTRVSSTETGKFIKLLAAAGVDDPEGWISSAGREVLDELDRLGQATTRVLGRRLPHLRIPLPVPAGRNTTIDQPALNRLLLGMGFAGHIARGEQTGTWANSQYAWSPMARWLPDGISGLDADAARIELARRWLRAFGPAPATDFAWWAGLPAGMSTRALEAAGGVEVDLGGGSVGLVAADDDEPVADPGPWVALLPALDPTTMGWKQRDSYLDPSLVTEVFDRNGNGGPTVWVDGRIVGGWAQRPDGEIAFELLEDVGSASLAAVEARAAALADEIGPVRFKVRFPAPMQRRLLA
jgi:hypothetical protein